MDDQEQQSQNTPKQGDVAAKDDTHFSKEIQLIIDSAEVLRMKRMGQYEKRGFISFTFGMMFIMAGGGGFAWFFLMESDPLRAFLSLIAGMIPSYLLHQFRLQPLKNYKREHKEVFMPALARTLGNLRFRTNAGIKLGKLRPARILPAHEDYAAEDCFHGLHKGIKLTISEARLHMPKHKGNDKRYAFDGVFVLLELPRPTFTGRTIIMGNIAKAREWSKRRWKDLSYVQTEDEGQESVFDVYSSNHEEAKKIARGEVLARLTELSKTFDNASISLSFYRERYIFIMIPYATDMFETSGLYLPITTREDALTRKREIEQIISIIDILSIYTEAPKEEPPSSSPPPAHI